MTGAERLLLIPGSGDDHGRWTALARKLAVSGFTSRLVPPQEAGGEAIAAQVAATRAAAGHDVVVVAGGRNALHALAAADRLDPAPPLVLISPSEPAERAYRSYRGEGAAKLFLIGNESTETAVGLAQASIGWTATVTYPTAARGTQLLAEWCEHVVDQIAGFASQAAASCPIESMRSHGARASHQPS